MCVSFANMIFSLFARFVYLDFNFVAHLIAFDANRTSATHICHRMNALRNGAVKRVALCFSFEQQNFARKFWQFQVLFLIYLTIVVFALPLNVGHAENKLPLKLWISISFNSDLGKCFYLASSPAASNKSNGRCRSSYHNNYPPQSCLY